MTETAQTVKDEVDTIVPYLQQAADQLGTTAQYLWQLQVRQAYVVGAIDLMWHVIWLIAVAVWMTIGFKVINKINSEDDVLQICYWLFGTFAATAIFVIIPSFKEMFTIFFNPDYYALNQTILLLKGAIHF